jgi:MutL protein
MTQQQKPPAPPASAELSLLVDVGSAWTKAAVIGRARGRWRIAASLAQPTTWGDVELFTGLASRLAGSVDPRLTDHLVDLIAGAPRIACHTPRRAGRLGLAAVSSELSAAAARRVAESAGWVIGEVATTDDGRSLADRLGALQAADVDAWLLAGGFDGGQSDQALEMAGLVAAARNGSRAPVVWAGADTLADAVEALFEPGAVRRAPNPRPAPEIDHPTPLRRELEEMLRQLVEPGEVRRLSPVAFRRGVSELARATRRRIVGVDLGARYASWVHAEADGAAESRVYAGGGLASGSLVAAGGPARLARSLPLAIDELAVADALQNARARPATIPQTDDELAITQAAARQLLAMGIASDGYVQGIDLLIGAGRVLAAAPRPAQAFAMLLDGVRPIGITGLAVDAAGALSPLGSLDDAEIGEGLGALRDDLLTPLGSSVVCRGGRPGAPAMRVTMRRTGWPDLGPIEVRTGQLVALPLGRGQQADLEIELEPGVSLGTPRRARRVSASIHGGVVGLVLDARGVPLHLPRRSDDRRAMLSSWRDVLSREAAMPTPLEASA